MRAREVVQSPVLVGRDESLALADRRLAEVSAGRGKLVLVAGEAGIGKTRLLASIARRAERMDFALVRAAAFTGDAEASGGVLLDLGSDLRQSADERFRELGAALSERLRAPAGGDGDQHRQRRLLVQDLADSLLWLPLEDGRPVLLVLEDLHWADQLSLEVIAHLAPRIGGRAVLVAGAYRSDELYPHSYLRRWRARLLNQRLAEELLLPRLTPAQTATLTSSVLRRPAPAQAVAAIHERSDGIPLHVEELLAAVDDAALEPESWPALRAIPVPDTLADAVLVHARALDPGARELAEAAAVIGRSFDFDLLVAVADEDPASVDHGLRQLLALHLVQPGGDAVSFDFRHALIRDALYTEISLPRRRLLHQRVARVAAGRGDRDAFVSAHFEQAGLAEPAHRHALRAAREAAALSAHREALELYRRALRNLPGDLPPASYAALLAALGAEAAAADDNEAAIHAFQQARDLWVQAGDALAAAAVVPHLVAVAHLVGEGFDGRVRRLEVALDSLDRQPGSERVRAQLLGALSAAYMLDRRLDQAIDYGERGRAIGEAAGDGQADLNTAATLGSVMVFAGRMDDGWALLEEAVTRSIAQRQEAEAARGYRMIGSSASVLVEYRMAEAWLSDGVDYAENVELWNHRHYMAAHLAHVQWARGEWEAAQRTAEHALTDGRGGITTRITAQYVLGYLALGRGDWLAATELLGEALSLGERMDELQRLSPPLWGLAETARLRGEHDRAVALCERGYAASVAVTDAAYLFPFLLTGVRAHLALDDPDGAERWLTRVEAALAVRSIPGTLPAITHGRGLLQLAAGEVAAARATLLRAGDAWRERSRFWEGTWALLDQASCALRSRRRAEAATLAGAASGAAERVGARTIVATAGALLRAGAGEREASPWHPLTRREYEIARLVAAGLTNREIAERLVVSPKTVGAHVEHILAKLGAARRAEIAAWAATVPG
jgi:DNA-binding CsgD family transcriptional regulator/tetratricopeptide (TPR) repeat protein